VTILYKKFTDTSFEVRYEVHSPHDGMRLDQYVQVFFPSFSRQHIKEKIKEGDIIIKDRPGKHKPNTKVYDKEQVTIFVYKTSHEDEWWKGEKLQLEGLHIEYEDDELYAITKPPYMSTHPTGKHLFNCATVHLEAKHMKTVHSIHRLDRETSGILLLAKSPKAAQTYTQCFENNQVSKCYFFIAVEKEGAIQENEFCARQRLDTGGEGLKRVIIGHHPEKSNIGKTAQTNFKVLYKEEVKGLKYVLGLAFPVTGRQHQIRVHALAHGFPLLGDKIYYGSYAMFQSFKDNYATLEDHDFLQLTRHALHATAINIPFKDSRKTFYSGLPKDLLNWVRSELMIKEKELQKLVKDSIDDYFKTSSK